MREIRPVRVKAIVGHERTGEHDVHHLVDFEAVAGLGQINLWGQQDQASG